jgi:hypothetical protein
VGAYLLIVLRCQCLARDRERGGRGDANIESGASAFGVHQDEALHHAHRIIDYYQYTESESQKGSGDAPTPLPNPRPIPLPSQTRVVSLPLEGYEDGVRRKYFVPVTSHVSYNTVDHADWSMQERRESVRRCKNAGREK